MEIPGITDRMKVADGRVQIRGGGCLPIIGILFLLTGCAAIAALVFGAFTLSETSEYVIATIMSLFFIAAGTVLVFVRYIFDIDGNLRTYRKRLSILITI